MNTETFSRFDPADYLDTVEGVAAYLEAVIDQGDDDPAVITQALGAIARSRNLSEIARQAGMSRQGLYKALSANGNPSFATVVKVSRALGLQVHFEAIAGRPAACPVEVERAHRPDRGAKTPVSRGLLASLRSLARRAGRMPR